MVSIEDLKSIKEKISKGIIDFIVEKYVSIHYSKKEFVETYLCVKQWLDQKYLDEGWYEIYWDYAVSKDAYIECRIPKELQQVYRKKIYYDPEEDYQEYLDSILDIKEHGAYSGIFYSTANIYFYVKRAYSSSKKIYDEAINYFTNRYGSLEKVIYTSEWYNSKKEFEQYLMDKTIIPSEIDENRPILCNDPNEENLQSLYENIPMEKEVNIGSDKELEEAFPFVDNSLTDEELYNKLYTECIINLKQDVYKQESEFNDLGIIINLFNALGQGFMYIAYDKLYEIVESLSKYDSKYDIEELKKTASTLDSLNRNIYDKGFDLLKEDPIKYLLITKYMKNTKNAAKLRIIFNIIFDDIKDNITTIQNYKKSKKEEIDNLPFLPSNEEELLSLLNCNELDINNNSIIFKASITSDYINILKKYNYDFNNVDSDGNDLIMVYFLYKSLNPQVIRDLLNTNFNIYHKNKNGETLLDIVIKKYYNNKEVISMFEKLYKIKITDIDIEFSNKLNEIDEKIKVYKKK